MSRRMQALLVSFLTKRIEHWLTYFQGEGMLSGASCKLLFS
jgi:hypothetical protein